MPNVCMTGVQIQRLARAGCVSTIMPYQAWLSVRCHIRATRALLPTQALTPVHTPPTIKVKRLPQRTGSDDRVRHAGLRDSRFPGRTAQCSVVSAHERAKREP